MFLLTLEHRIFFSSNIINVENVACRLIYPCHRHRAGCIRRQIPSVNHIDTDALSIVFTNTTRAGARSRLEVTFRLSTQPRRCQPRNKTTQTFPSRFFTRMCTKVKVGLRNVTYTASKESETANITDKKNRVTSSNSRADREDGGVLLLWLSISLCSRRGDFNLSCASLNWGVPQRELINNPAGGPSECLHSLSISA